ncbi:MAG: hypothetical protein GX639_19065 [Fibrobacter sp.]|nr:hypothetical protein [Fibrobacter sp.]
MSYPTELLRGITAKDQIDDDEFPSSVLFYFTERDNLPKRSDNNIEESINWRDDAGADDVLFNQLKEDKQLQFRFGAAVVCRHELDRVIQTNVVNHQLSYERKAIPENKYHGNLLLSRDVPPRVRKKISATIATMCVKKIMPNPNNQL